MPPKNAAKRPDKLSKTDERQRIKAAVLSRKQVQDLISACQGSRDRIIIKFLYFYGMRASEVGLVRLSDIDLEHRKIEIVRLKSSMCGVYPIPEDLAVDIKAWIGGAETSPKRSKSQWLIPHSMNRSAPIDKYSVGRVFRRLCNHAGIPKTIAHSSVMKHTIVHHMLDAGETIRNVQLWVGHKMAATTEIYARTFGKLKNQGEDVAMMLAKQMFKCHRYY